MFGGAGNRGHMMANNLSIQSVEDLCSKGPTKFAKFVLGKLSFYHLNTMQLLKPLVYGPLAGRLWIFVFVL